MQQGSGGPAARRRGTQPAEGPAPGQGWQLVHRAATLPAGQSVDTHLAALKVVTMRAGAAGLGIVLVACCAARAGHQAMVVVDALRSDVGGREPGHRWTGVAGGNE